MARKKGPQADLAYSYIKEKILTFAFEPGAEISDHKLLQSLAMSRSPIREALMRLMADGLIEQSDSKLIVSPMSLREVVEICQVRKAIEMSAVAIVLDRGGLSAEQLAQMQAITAEMRQQTTLMQNYELDDQFHGLLVQLSGNRRMIDISNRMRLQISRARWLNLFFPERLENAVREHDGILQALSARSLDESLRALTVHLDNSEQMFQMALNNPAFSAQFLRGIATMLGPQEPPAADALP